LYIFFSFNLFNFSILLRIFLIFLSFLLVTSIQSQNLDLLINELEKKMENRHVFDQKKEARIKILEQKASQSIILEDKYQINNEIISEYQFYSFDKTLEYIERNLAIAESHGDSLFINETKLILSILLVESGRYKESIDALNGIKRESLPSSLVNKYFIAFKEGYSGLSYNTTVNTSKIEYSNLYNAYQDSLYARLDPNSEESLRLKEKELRDARDLDAAIKINDKRLSYVKTGTRDFSLITFERSLLYELLGEYNKQKEYLILSAMSDIESSVKDNASMGSLAKIMFSEGDIDRAHRYINFSFDDAEFYNSQLRFVIIANNLPMITKAYEERSEKQKLKLKKLLIFISVLAVFLIIAIYLVFKQVKKVSVAKNKLKIANKKLKEFNNRLNASNEDLKKLYEELSKANEIKEHYIGTFLNLYSEYITKLDTYRKLVRKYVNANQTQSLLELSKSKQLIDEELEIFNKNFDSAFLHIHPNFVDSVNKMLKADKQISLNHKSKLNTELRILALIKLGITDSSRIAKILRYSVNTIYNYKAAIKNALKDKSHFEEKVKNII